MNLTVNDKGLGDIKTAVLYKYHKFLPEPGYVSKNFDNILSDCTAFKVQRLCSKTQLVCKSFAEYDFSFIPDKDKITDELVINYLDPDTKKIMGIRYEDIQRIEESMFPSLGQDDNSINESDISYFSSIIVANRPLVMLNIPADVYKIELYEDTLESNNNFVGGFLEHEYFNEEYLPDSYKNYLTVNSPCMTITLGPSKDLANNSDSMYYRTSEKGSKLISNVDYWALQEEIKGEKVICIYLSENSQPEVNLSYRAWASSKNPNRHSDKYTLRADKYFSTKDNTDIISTIPGTDLIFDSVSGSLLGTELSQGHLLKHRINNVTGITEKYSPFTRYRIGDRVLYHGRLWESLSNNNYHNNPYFSGSWVLVEAINKSLTRKLRITANPIGAGYISPSVITLSKEKVPDITFSITENNGYSLKGEGEATIMNRSTFGNIVLNTSQTEEFGSKIIKNTVYAKDGLDKLLEVNDKGEYLFDSLVFNFDRTENKIVFSLFYDGTKVDFKNITSTFSANFPILIEKLLFNNVEYSIPNSDYSDWASYLISSNGKIEGFNAIVGQDIFSIIGKKNGSYGYFANSEYRISRINLQYYQDSSKSMDELVNESDGEYSSLINHSNLECVFYVEAVPCIIDSIFSFDKYAIDSRRDLIESGKDHYFRFYNLTGNFFNFNKLEITCFGRGLNEVDPEANSETVEVPADSDNAYSSTYVPVLFQNNVNLSDKVFIRKVTVDEGKNTGYIEIYFKDITKNYTIKLDQ